MLSIRQLSKTYPGPHGKVCALKGISLTVNPGEFVAVQGPSGCGKSTLLLAAGGLLEPEAGEVSVNGQNLYQLSAGQRSSFRASAIGFVFQQFHLIPYLSVLDNVVAPVLALGMAHAKERAAELIEHFKLSHRIHHVPSELSTGERQRTALARALLNRPKLLLADEPTGNLDSENAEIVLKYLSEFTQSGGTTLLVTHDAHAAGFAVRRITLENGSIA